MARLDVDGDQVVIQTLHSPRLPKVMKRLRARHDGRHWRTKAHRALDVLDAMRYGHPECTEAFEDLEYRIRYGGDPDDVQACLAIKHGLEQPMGVPELRKPLYPYQEQAVAFLHRAGSGILADEPGLGKTLQGIAFALMGDGPTLVVCPATAKHVWAREIEAATDAEHQVIQGTAAVPIAPSDFVIINHDVLASHADRLAAHGFATLIVDEAHRCKNIKAQRTKALIRIADQIPRKALLSGTLLMNDAQDLYPPLRIVRPQAYPDAWAFFDRYMTSRSLSQNVRGRRVRRTIREGGRNLAELHERMSGFTIRRTLADVRDQLPELRQSVMAIDLPEDLQRAYALRRHALSKARPEERIGQVHGAMASCIEAKRRVVADVVEDRLAAGRKVLVFSSRLALLDELSEQFPDDSLRIDGSVPTHERRGIEERFQAGDVPLFLGQTRACSEALTLDAADTVVIADADWSPQANEQAIRRALRVNTQHAVEVVWLVVKDTLDEARLDVLRRKRADFDAVMDGVIDEALAAGV